MKKIIGILLAICLMATVFAGCGNEIKTAKNDIYTIKWYDIGPKCAEQQMVFDELNKYLEEKIGARVEYYPILPAEYTEKLQMMLASGEKFDMCHMATAQNYTQFANNSAFMDVGELLKKSAPETAELLPDYALEAAKVNGTLYAVPVYKDFAEQGVFYYRKDLAEKYNLDMSSIKTIEDMEPMLETIKQNEQGVIPFYFNGLTETGSPFYFLEFDYVAGGLCAAMENFGEESEIINPFETEKAKEYFRMIHRFYEAGYIKKDIVTDNKVPEEEQMFIQLSSELPYLIDQRNMTFEYEWGLLDIIKPQMNTNNLRGALFSVSQGCENPEKVMMFINLLNTDAYVRNLVSYGIEGRHYIKVDDNHFRLPDGVSNKTELPYYTYVYPQGNAFIKLEIEGTPDDIHEKYIEFNNSALQSSMLGFSFDASEYLTEYAAVNNAYKEYMPAIFAGAVDPDEYLPKALDKMNSVGLETLLNAAREQYAEWKKTK